MDPEFFPSARRAVRRAGDDPGRAGRRGHPRPHPLRLTGAVSGPRSRRAVAGSRRRSEELERDPVGVAEAQAGAVGRVLDRRVLVAQLVEAVGPLLELGAVGAAERDVVETDVVLAEAAVRRRGLVLVQTEEGARRAGTPCGACRGSVSSSSTGLASKSASYQGTLTDRSRTVTATWVRDGKGMVRAFSVCVGSGRPGRSSAPGRVAGVTMSVHRIGAERP